MNKLADLEFGETEQKQLEEKIRRSIGESGLDGILALDSGNFTYLSRGVVLPFSDQKIMLPSLVFVGRDPQQDFIICPPQVVQVLRDQNWEGKTAVYSINDGTPPTGLTRKAGELLRDKKNIGFAPSMLSADLYRRLQTSLPSTQLTDAEEMLKHLREVKTPGEIRMLEVAARIAERGFVSALNHTEGNLHDTLNYYLWEFGERIRVHVGEFGGSMTGNLTVQQGQKSSSLSAKLDIHENFCSGNFLRAEWTSHNYGYWSNNSRTVFIGQPDDEAVQHYQDNLILKKAALDSLKPGIPASDVFEAVASTSRTRQIPFRKEFGIGHGVGTTEMESPFLDGIDSTVLTTGMVLAVGVYTCGSSGELICSRDTYEITDTGSRLLSWYKTYDDLYCMYGSSARHG